MATGVDSIQITGSKTHKLSFLRLVRSEWIKVFTLRSTWWILGFTVVLNIGISLALIAALRYAEYIATTPMPGAEEFEFEVELGSLGMLSNVVVTGCGFVGQLVFIIFAVLAITNEYSSGMIRSTFTASPRRLRVLLAKLVVIATLCIPIFAISVGASWAGGYAILQGCIGVDVTLTSAVSLRIMGGFLISITLLALFCFGLGTIIRSTAGSIGMAVGIIVVLPMVFSVLLQVFATDPDPTGWVRWLMNASEFLPTTAGWVITQPEFSDSAILGPWEGVGVLGAWTLGCLVIGFTTTVRRDV
ncbi:MAG: ABC transporter permease [Propionibacteriaceae bacterium]|nr:ABC transporter permease [Propionibacteriaceae bacterium]